MEAFSAHFKSTNAQLSASSLYRVPQLEIDFQVGSTNFAQTYLDPAGYETSVAAITPPGLVLYCTQAIHEKREVSRNFSGYVEAHLDFYLRYSALRDRATYQNDISEDQASWETEAFVDCVQDSAFTVLTSDSAFERFRAANAILSNYRADRDPVIQLETGDGFRQRLALTLGFTVHAR